MNGSLKLGTRGSPLALAQARKVAAALETAQRWPAGYVEIVPIKTTGDKVQDRPLAEIGGKYLWTKELDRALLAGDVDFNVAKLYDMIHPNAVGGKRTAADNATVRSVFVVGPDKKGAPVTDGTYVYVVNDRGIMWCLDLKTGKVGPGLAVSWRPVDDTTWEVKLRQGVKFHNGEPFDAEAVKFSFERINRADFKSPQKGWFNTIDRVEIVDPHTVKIHTKKPWPIFVATPAISRPVTSVHKAPQRAISSDPGRAAMANRMKSATRRWSLGASVWWNSCRASEERRRSFSG